MFSVGWVLVFVHVWSNAFGAFPPEFENVGGPDKGSRKGEGSFCCEVWLSASGAFSAGVRECGRAGQGMGERVCFVSF